MRKLILILLSCSMAACATTENAQSIAAKSMLTSRQAVIGAATATDALCKQKTLSEANCAMAKVAYDQFQICYGAATDTFLLYLQKGAGDYNALAAQVVACQQTFGGVK